MEKPFFLHFAHLGELVAFLFFLPRPFCSFGRVDLKLNDFATVIVLGELLENDIKMRRVEDPKDSKRGNFSKKKGVEANSISYQSNSG